MSFFLFCLWSSGSQSSTVVGGGAIGRSIPRLGDLQCDVAEEVAVPALERAGKYRTAGSRRPCGPQRGRGPAPGAEDRRQATERMWVYLWVGPLKPGRYGGFPG